MEYHKWGVYCTIDNKLEFVWALSKPTQCPSDANHSIISDSTCIYETVNAVKTITAHNSPFKIKHKSFYICDCTSGQIQVELPPASNERVLEFVKKGSGGSCVLIPFENQTIDGKTSLSMILPNSFAQILASTNNNWVLKNPDQLANGSYSLTKPNFTDDRWLFHESYSKAVNGGDNIVGAWTVRQLNQTIVDGGYEIILKQNNILQLEPGFYEIKVCANFFNAGFTKLRLFCQSTNEEALVGLNSYSQSSTTQSVSFLDGFFEVFDSSKEFTIQYFSTRSQKLSGLGRATGFGPDEIYTQVHFRRVGNY